MRRGVLLGPNKPRNAPLQILVPRGYEEAPPYSCLICGSKFYAGQESLWQRHVGDCARKNLDEIRATTPSARNKGTMFDDEVLGDPEIKQHFKKVRKTMEAEGRWEVNPNERAGFS